MTKRKSGSAPVPPSPRVRAGRTRQRQHLIDACISALHLYGPSKTTVEKVVAVAKMSPGIVRFYFESKDAMLVASLNFLSTEFEELLLIPVTRLQDQPVAALQLLVDLYLNAEIASARKVSVWYAFWGEANSRQEYYDICGKKDERFASLVRTLVERLIIGTSQFHLDPDGIALGLIGVLEILWQGFAFQTEERIDREAAKHRCMAYLRSVFPGQFPPTRADQTHTSATGATDAALPPWSYQHAGLHGLERAQLFEPSWQLLGHTAEVARNGAYLCRSTATERALLLRDPHGRIRAWRNSCPAQPHQLLEEASGELPGSLACPVHGLHFSVDDARLSAIGLEADPASGLIFIRSRTGPDSIPPLAPLLQGWMELRGVTALRPTDYRSAQTGADWKLIIETWLDTSPPDPDSWTARRYHAIADGAAALEPVRWFMPPNLVCEARWDGLSAAQVCPLGPGRSRIDVFRYAWVGVEAPALAYLARRREPWGREEARRRLESAQTGLVEYHYVSPSHMVHGAQSRGFQRWLRARLPPLVQTQAPNLW